MQLQAGCIGHAVDRKETGDWDELRLSPVIENFAGQNEGGGAILFLFFSHFLILLLPLF